MLTSQLYRHYDFEIVDGKSMVYKTEDLDYGILNVARMLLRVWRASKKF